MSGGLLSRRAERGLRRRTLHDPVFHQEPLTKNCNDAPHNIPQGAHASCVFCQASRRATLPQTAQAKAFSRRRAGFSQIQDAFHGVTRAGATSQHS
jgi:hypothetical protein